MIVSTIEDAGRYSAISAGLKLAIEWLQARGANAVFEKGITALGEAVPGQGEITVKCEEPALVPPEKARLEAHRRFIDIHVPLKGTEIIGWAPVEVLKHCLEPYSDERDVSFFGDSAHSLLNVRRGQIAIFFPEDAHAPNIGLGNHRKLCIKIPVGR